MYQRPMVTACIASTVCKPLLNGKVPVYMSTRVSVCVLHSLCNCIRHGAGLSLRC